MKNNNKGFSLVELIVVIAIMAVLVGVLAPTLLRYVEKSRIQKDASAVAEVVNAARIAVAEEAINDEVAASLKTGTCSISCTMAADKKVTINVTGSTKLQNELRATIQNMKFSGKDACTVTITLASDDEGYKMTTAAATTGTAWADAVAATSIGS